jgi:hypothetical protein
MANRGKWRINRTPTRLAAPDHTGHIDFQQVKNSARYRRVPHIPTAAADETWDRITLNALAPGRGFGRVAADSLTR